MSERELLLEINRLSRESKTLSEAIEQTQFLFAREIGAAILFVHPIRSGASFVTEKAVVDFLESREFPFRGVYTAPLVSSRKPKAMLVACFGSWGAPGDFLLRATAHAGRQLDALLISAYGGILPRYEAA